MDSTARRAFEHGRLNPYLVQSGLQHADRWMEAFDPDRPKVRALIHGMSEQLGRIERVARKHGARVLVVSMPMGHYVDRQVLQRRQAYGFQMDERMLLSDATDIEIGRAAAETNLPFYTVTEQFRHQEGQLFFTFDTHLNGAGHHFFADAVAPIVANALAGPRNRAPGA